MRAINSYGWTVQCGQQRNIAAAMQDYNRAIIIGDKLLVKGNWSATPRVKSYL